jgi:hypothetical protein
MSLLRVLIACEESQALCIEFRKLGFEAYSCDILPCSENFKDAIKQWNINKLLVKNQWNTDRTSIKGQR